MTEEDARHRVRWKLMIHCCNPLKGEQPKHEEEKELRRRNKSLEADVEYKMCVRTLIAKNVPHLISSIKIGSRRYRPQSAHNNISYEIKLCNQKMTV